MKRDIAYIILIIALGILAAFSFSLDKNKNTSINKHVLIGWRVIKYGTEYNKLPATDEAYARSQAVSVGGRVEPIYSE